MADNDYNMIKPVEGLQNIGGLTPAKRREERKRKKESYEQNEEEPQQQLTESADEENIGNQLTENEKADQNSIDYCA